MKSFFNIFFGLLGLGSVVLIPVALLVAIWGDTSVGLKLALTGILGFCVAGVYVKVMENIEE